MKKLISVILCAAVAVSSLFLLSGCSAAEQAKYDIVFITDGGTVKDGAYNESAWNGKSA